MNGFEGGARNIALGASTSETSATVLGGMMIVLVSMGGVAFSATNELSALKRFLILLLFCLAEFAALRLGSRTLLVVGFAALLAGLLLNAKHIGISRFVALAIPVSVAFYFALSSASSTIDISTYFQDRQESSEFGASTIGGRLGKWTRAIELLVESPLGWTIFGNGYAHNFWLDAARNGGWLSLAASILVAAAFLETLYRALKRNRHDVVFVTTSYCLTLGFFMLFLVEPILDGFVYVFGAFCCFWGVVAAYPYGGYQSNADARKLGSGCE